MPGVYLIWLGSPQIAPEAKPGQFVMVRCGEDTLLRRPLSIHQLDGNKLALLFTVVGKGTHWLSQRQAGNNIDLLGPLGNGFSIHPASHNLLLVAGGIGIAPLYSLASSASKEGYSIRILLGARTATQLYLKEYQYQPIKAEFVLVTEDGTTDEKGIITNLIPKYIDWADQIFACGPVGMYRTMAQMPELKNKPVQISLEVRMGCGLGVCYGCTVKTKNGLKQVCKDGPVFDLDDILWDELNCF
ncbi:MAG: dihydroorotate dehydrogenase electron transfer subunit [Dehalococcoidia bacterium]|nr:MAG: dihydroorotate dehydrogenase electron transfer subunit [Dehalococcoidia bacterium]